MLMQHLTTNLAGKTRYETMEGREYLVAPMVMMAEGVLTGTSGAFFYPKEELAKTPAVWNHKPIVVYHPMCNGEAVSACDPDILSTQKVGVIMNTRFTDDGKLKAEAWLDTARIEEVDPRVLEAIESDTVMELSTGLFTDNETKEGVFDGVSYNSIARNYRPDHLALLPDKTGAFSVEAGAGFLQNEMSFDKIREGIQKLAREKYPSGVGNDFDVWVSDVYSDFFILEQGVDLLKIPYTKSNDEVAIGDDSVKVKRKTEYVTMDGSFVGNANVEYVSLRKEETMSKDNIVGELIANKATLWKEEDTEFLMTLEEDQLEKFVPVVNEDVTNSVTDPVTDPVTEGVSAPVVNEDAVPVTANEYIANAPDGIRDMLTAGLQTHEAQRQTLIANIKGNKRNVFTDEQLAPKALGELQALAALCVEDKVKPVALYGGAAAPAPMTNAVTEEPLVAPELTWD